MIDRRWIVAVLVVALVACSDGASDGEVRDGGDGLGAEASTPGATDDAVSDGAVTDDADAAPGADDGPLLGTAPPTTLPDCPALVLAYEFDWPYAVPPSLQPTEFVEDGLAYRIEGTTNDPESVLVQVMDDSLADFVANEPEGDADEIAVTFSSLAGDAELAMSDGDGDGCWDVEIAVEYLEAPADDQTTDAEEGDGVAPDAPDADDPADDDPLDGLPSIGSGSVVTARGTFPIYITRCDAAPLAMSAVASEGELVVAAGDDGRFEMSWTYADGVVISDDDAIMIGLEPAGGSFVADGEGPDGPETVIVEYRCDNSA